MAIIKFMWCEIIKQILADMRQPLQYVPWALVIVVLGLVVTIVLSEKKDGKKASVRFFRILFAIYILVVIQITFFSREPGSRNGCMNLDLFSTWGYSVVTHAFFIENISYDSAFRNSGTALFSPAAADVEMCCTRRCLFGSDGTEPVRDETRVL